MNLKEAKELYMIKNFINEKEAEKKTSCLNCKFQKFKKGFYPFTDTSSKCLVTKKKLTDIAGKHYFEVDLKYRAENCDFFVNKFLEGKE